MNENNVEIWKDIKGYEGSYQVSNTGQVKSLNRFTSNNQYLIGKIIKTRINMHGYKYLSLSKNHNRWYTTIHNLVALHFCIKKNKLSNQVNHKDGNKLNNNSNNLEWCTAKENIRHAIKNGLIIVKKEEQHWKCKLTKQQVIDMRKMYKTGNYTYLQLSEIFKIKPKSIGNIINYMTWKNVI